MTLFSMDSGVKRVADALTDSAINNEIELAKTNGWIIYDAAGYDTIEMVKKIIFSVEYIDKDFAFSLVEQLREIKRELFRAYDKINGVNFDYDEDN